MHLDRVQSFSAYRRYLGKKRLFFLALCLCAGGALCLSLSVGASGLPLDRVLRGLVGLGDSRDRLILWNIRMPQAMAAVVAGAALSLSGVAMQAIL